MFAKSVSKPFSGKDWIFEIKWDGFRAIAYVDDYFTVQSRNAKELKYFFPELEELRELARNVVVDGEIVTMKQGKVDFHALQERGHLISVRDLRLSSKSLKKKSLKRLNDIVEGYAKIKMKLRQ